MSHLLSMVVFHSRGDVTPLNLLVISEAPVVGVDVLNGWEQGGGHVNVELGGWAPTGLMDCHFGTVVVPGAAVAELVGQGVRRWEGQASGGQRRRLLPMSSV